MATLEFCVEGNTFDYECGHPLLVAYGDADPVAEQRAAQARGTN